MSSNNTNRRLPAVNASNVLANAADTILSRGRARGDFTNSRGGVCAIGALRLGAGSSSPNTPPTGPRQRSAYNAAVRALGENLGASDVSDFTGIDYANSEAGNAIADWSDSGHMSAKRIATRLLTVSGNL